MIIIILGTRPEAIKLAPVILEFKKSKSFITKVISTGQHYEMVQSVMNIFGLKVDIDLQIMKKKQSLEYITNTIIKKLSQLLTIENPDLVIVQGDTTSAFAASICSFYQKIPVAHVEAGLRTDDLYSPFPEEINRRLISQIASLHFAPTQKAFTNLKNANVLGEIHLTGNTVIDSIRISLKNLPEKKFKNIYFSKDKVILATIHRRENWGQNIENFCNGILNTLDENKNVSVILPMHPNSIVRKTIKKLLSKHSKVCLTEPLKYTDFLYALKNCYLVVTDSGGIQEEAPFLQKPVLIFRDTTERKESVELGSSKLIGTSSENLKKELNCLLKEKSFYAKMIKHKDAYGDGFSSKRILEACKKNLEKINVN